VGNGSPERVGSRAVTLCDAPYLDLITRDLSLHAREWSSACNISSRIDFINLNWLHRSAGRNCFTKSDDDNLAIYIAKVKPTNSGRQGKNLYISLEESVSDSFANTGKIQN
jgi:hypothetical protein